MNNIRHLIKSTNRFFLKNSNEILDNSKTHQCRFSSIWARNHPLHVKQYSGIKLFQLREFRRSPGFGTKQSENSSKFSQIAKPFGFTILVGGGSLILCTIWEYESARSNRLNRPNFNLQRYFSKDVKTFPESQPRGIFGVAKAKWNSLSPEDKVFWPICFLNGLVFLAWRFPYKTAGPLNFMKAYFTTAPALSGPTRSLPLLLSTFSHHSLLHFGVNMFVLHSFMPVIMSSVGKEQFASFYLSAGVVSSFASHLHKVVIASAIPSLGASGAIMGILGFACTQSPDLQLAFIFLPNYAFSSETAVYCILALDTVGLLAGWKFLDHAAHLGGCLFGIAYCKYAEQVLGEFRRSILKTWHQIREH